jgi:hypothetical protein
VDWKSLGGPWQAKWAIDAFDRCERTFSTDAGVFSTPSTVKFSFGTMLLTAASSLWIWHKGRDPGAFGCIATTILKSSIVGDSGVRSAFRFGV